MFVRLVTAKVRTYEGFTAWLHFLITASFETMSRTHTHTHTCAHTHSNTRILYSVLLPSLLHLYDFFIPITPFAFVSAASYPSSPTFTPFTVPSPPLLSSHCFLPCSFLSSLFLSLLSILSSPLLC